MKKIYSFLALAGCLIWVAAVVLRGTEVAANPVGDFLLGIAPNFGAAWAVVGLTLTFWPFILRRPFDMGKFALLLLATLLALLASEVVHMLWLGARFDIWDMVASVVALLVLALVRVAEKKKIVSE